MCRPCRPDHEPPRSIGTKPSPARAAGKPRARTRPHSRPAAAPLCRSIRLRRGPAPGSAARRHRPGAAQSPGGSRRGVGQRVRPGRGRRQAKARHRRAGPAAIAGRVATVHRLGGGLHAVLPWGRVGDGAAGECAAAGHAVGRVSAGHRRGAHDAGPAAGAGCDDARRPSDPTGPDPRGRRIARHRARHGPGRTDRSRGPARLASPNARRHQPGPDAAPRASQRGPGLA